MANRNNQRFYRETQDTFDIPINPNLVSSSPPYDNLIVIDAPPTITLQQTQQSQNRTHIIPGPARPVQQGLFRKRAHNARILQGESSQARPTQDFIRDAMNEPQGVDLDFHSPRWTATIDYLIREGSYTNRTPPFWTQIAEFHGPSSQFVKVKKIVAMISTLTPNDMGDLHVTLKDLSGRIDASMHHSIFINDEYRLATTVGAVVILRNCTLCRFTFQEQYLNIVADNIVKIIGVNSMIAEYEPNELATIKDETMSRYKFFTVQDSDDDE